MSPTWIAPIVTWLGQRGGGRRDGPGVRGVRPGARRRRGLGSWSATEPVDDPTRLGAIVEGLLADARPNSGMNGEPGGRPQPQSDRRN